nr:reverse transcriptase domain-containing protein [Tanacetum cinerariifolium]
MLQPHRNQSVVRQTTAFKSERPRISKPRCNFQVDVHNDLSKPFTTHYLPKEREDASAKPHHMIASSNSRISSKNMTRFSSNDMVHNHYLEEAKKRTQERSGNSEPSLMHSARSQSTANGSKPIPRRNSQTSRSWPASKNSFVMTKNVPIAEHSRNSRNFSDSKHFVCSTCQKCVFSANHDSFGLRWVSTGRILTSSTTKVDSEPLAGSNADITNQYECKQTLDVSAEHLSDTYVFTMKIEILLEPSSNKLLVDVPVMRTSKHGIVFILYNEKPKVNETELKKMLKALLSNKDKLQELANTPLNENCSPVILKKLPKKLRNHGKFLISCGFSVLKCKAQANLDASINLMPLSVWKKLDIDSSLKDSIDQSNLAKLNDNFVDSLSEMFTDEHALKYSPPPIFDEYDDDLFEVESNTENVYDDPFDCKGEKIKESKLLIEELDIPCDFLPSEYDSFISQDFSRVDALPSANNEDKVFNPSILIPENPFEIITRVAKDKMLAISNASLVIKYFDIPLYELSFFKEVQV